MSSEALARQYVLNDPSATTSRQKLVRIFTNLAVGVLLLFMAFQAFKSWADIYHLQADRLHGNTKQSSKEDYVTFYSAGKMALRGEGAHLYDLDFVAQVEHEIMGRPVGGSGSLAYFNPPFVAGLFAPLALLSVTDFGLAYMVIVIATLFAGGLLLQRCLRLRSLQERLFFWLLLLSLQASWLVVIQQQLSMLLFLGYLGWAWGLYKGKERLSGASLVLVLVKPQMALLPVLFLISRKQWRALGVFAALAGTLSIASIAISGPAVLLDYPRYLFSTTSWQNHGVTTEAMFGWNGLIARLIGSRNPPFALVAAVDVATLTVVALALRGPSTPSSHRVFLQAGLVLTAALLINPHLYLQDLVLVALAIALGAAHNRAKAGTWGVWPALAIVAWLMQIYAPRLQSAQGVPLLTISLIGLMALFATLLIRKPAVLGRREEPESYLAAA